ncbi:hypothetical protein F441_23132 [Phytophthora nicotianae CJ01A1]|uniref:Uncharacterized protein n=3 Tax=Phytophthora nicotianae TaxID=4792 RepID=W2Y2T4_PHYNI|nr:hypothetical protein L915_21996 [Phytophthora nicotianae]ETL33018.1 hypothetical protein L916_14467 [Phytophthora nicotianae]ETL77571.1 hypothetical protein L917_21488 [Phytophthora nicotianae]ETO99452.1 hypothetical protein F441_23132 [Phytophthora nicotianae CJ01A1]ETP28504.1 hypothetical protein F442_22203 [Phytophthora nicotianae P10297]
MAWYWAISVGIGRQSSRACQRYAGIIRKIPDGPTTSLIPF